MITQISDDFDLEKTAESGQCFRWEKTKTAIGAAHPPAAGAGPAAAGHKGIADGAGPAAAGHKGKADGVGSPYTYRIIAGNACLYITALDTGKGLYDLDCTEDQYSAFWHGYFDLDENYRRIRERIDPVKDPFLREAADREKGIPRESVFLSPQVCARDSTQRRIPGIFLFWEMMKVISISQGS